MDIEQKDIEALKKEIERLNSNISSLGDSMRSSVRAGVVDGNNDSNKKKKTENDTDMAEKVNEKLFLRQKDQHDKSQEMRQTKVKTPEQLAQEQFNKQQTTTNDYLKQLATLTRENNYNALKNPTDKKREEDPYAITSILGKFTRGLASGGTTKNPFENIVSGGAGVGVALKDNVSMLKGFFERNSKEGRQSTKRQKTIESSKKDINKEKAILSAEEAELTKLKKQPKSAENKAEQEELKKSIASRKTSITGKANTMASTMTDEYLHQKKRQDKEFTFQGKDKELVSKQMRDNITASLTGDLDPTKTKQKSKVGESAIGGGIGDVSKSFTKLNTSIDKLSTSINKQNANTDKLLSAITELKNQKNTSEPTPNEADAIINRKSKKKLSTDGGLDTGVIDTSPTKGNDKSIFSKLMDTAIKDTSNPRTYGEYIAGIYKKLNKPEEKKPELEVPEPEEEGDGIMGMLGKFMPLLAGLGPIMASAGAAIAAVAGPLAVAVVGGIALKSAYDESEKNTTGTTLGDVGGGIKGLFNGKGFTGGLEERQTDRVTKLGKKEGDANVIEAGKTGFNRDQLPLLTPYKKYISDAEIDGLRNSYIDAKTGNTSFMEYKISRNKLLRQAKEIQESEGSVDAEFTQLTSGTSPKTPSSTPTTGGKNEGSKQKIETKSSMTGMTQASGIDQMTAMTIQAKLIAMEMMNMQKSPDYINKQRELMKDSGYATADRLTGN